MNSMLLNHKIPVLTCKFSKNVSTPVQNNPKLVPNKLALKNLISRNKRITIVDKLKIMRSYDEAVKKDSSNAVKFHKQIAEKSVTKVNSQGILCHLNYAKQTKMTALNHHATCIPKAVSKKSGSRKVSTDEKSNTKAMLANVQELL